MTKIKKRLGIYFFTDSDGIFDSSSKVLLEGLSPFLDTLVFVYRGKLNEASKEEIQKFTKTILPLKKGHRADAYKTGLLSVDENARNSFEEILFFDSSLVGPFCNLNDMFSSMETESNDFWGLYFRPSNVMNTRELLYHKKGKFSVMPGHIPWSFFSVKKSLFSDKVFLNFIAKIRPLKSEGVSDYKFNIKSTSVFIKNGFEYSSYLDMEGMDDYSPDLLSTSPLYALKEKKSPFLYSEVFKMNPSKTLEYTLGQETKEALEYIEKKTDYDKDILIDNILRTGNQHDIKSALGLTYALPSDYTVSSKSDSKKLSVALCMHLYYPDLFEYCLEYAKSMPKKTHVFITTNSKEKKKEIEDVFSSLPCEKLEVRVIGNRGRDVSSLLIGCKDVVENYDVICYAHDKKTTQHGIGCIGDTFSYQCFENILKSSDYVNNIVRTFADNPRLGILSPSLPFHSVIYTTLGREWTSNYENTVALAEKSGIKVPMDENKPPIAPLGTMFWFRGKALVGLLDENLTYDDFPKEPNNVNGTILHAYERLYPYAAQSEGYMVGECVADTYAELQIINQYHMLQTLSRELFSKFDDDCNDFNSMMRYVREQLHVIPNLGLYYRIKRSIVLKRTPGKILALKSFFRKIIPKKGE